MASRSLSFLFVARSALNDVPAGLRRDPAPVRVALRKRARDPLFSPCGVKGHGQVALIRNCSACGCMCLTLRG
jgi:hypothetical protein